MCICVTVCNCGTCNSVVLCVHETVHVIVCSAFKVYCVSVILRYYMRRVCVCVCPHALTFS